MEPIHSGYRPSESFRPNNTCKNIGKAAAAAFTLLAAAIVGAAILFTAVELVVPALFVGLIALALWSTQGNGIYVEVPARTSSRTVYYSGGTARTVHPAARSDVRRSENSNRPLA